MPKKERHLQHSYVSEALQSCITRFISQTLPPEVGIEKYCRRPRVSHPVRVFVSALQSREGAGTRGTDQETGKVS